ncbi:MAG: hypothetical protein RIQ52_1246 [Pseudomonadota bacterium]
MQSHWPGSILLEDASPDLRLAFAEEMQHQCIDAGRSQALAAVYLPLATWIAARHQTKGNASTLIVGINGAQGSGKSTLCAFLARILEVQHHLNVAVLSIDDLYHDRSTRQCLARQIHPLLATRGVPGTHDIALGQQLFDRLASSSEGTHDVRLPVFDKATDDRLPENRWRPCKAPVDIILFEGWCVGAVPEKEAALSTAINLLEQQEDPDGAWRRYVNTRLGDDYARLFQRLDCLIMLKIPDFASIRCWRGLQEQKLREKLEASGETGGHLMTATELDRFIMHYERLTRHQLAEMPTRADMVLTLDQDHEFCGMTMPSPLQP